MPRKRESWETKRARELNQEAADRRQREAILASRATEATPTPTPTPDLPPPAAEALPEPSQESPEWPMDAQLLNAKVNGLLRQRYGAAWASNPSLHKLAERAAQDLAGLGDGKALHHLRTTATNGTYEAALQARHGLLPGEVAATHSY